MKTTFIVLGIVVAIVLFVAVIGWSLPVKHQASRQATFRASPDSVYAIITNVQDFPAWRSKVKTAEIVPTPGGVRSFRESGSDGAILYVIDEATPGRRLVTRIADDKLPFGGKWTYELTPAANNGTTLQITEDGEVYNPIFRFMSRFVFGHTATIDAYLTDLGKRLGAPVNQGAM